MKWILVILIPLLQGCSQFKSGISKGDLSLAWQDVKDSFNPALPDSHFGETSNPWHLAARDRSMGINLPLSAYGIYEDPDVNRRLHQRDTHWDKLMVWDPYLRKYRPYRSRVEYLNGVK